MKWYQSKLGWILVILYILIAALSAFGFSSGLTNSEDRGILYFLVMIGFAIYSLTMIMPWFKLLWALNLPQFSGVEGSHTFEGMVYTSFFILPINLIILYAIGYGIQRIYLTRKIRKQKTQ